MPRVSSRLVRGRSVVRSIPTVSVPAEVDAKIISAIRLLESKNSGRYAGRKGVHVVFSGLNQEVYRVGLATKETIAGFWSALAERGIIQIRGAKGGAIVYVAGEMPQSVPADGKAHGLLG